jgi:hypothetical protein
MSGSHQELQGIPFRRFWSLTGRRLHVREADPRKTQTAIRPSCRLRLGGFLLAECIKHQAHPIRHAGLFKNAKNVVLYSVFAEM